MITKNQVTIVVCTSRCNPCAALSVEYISSLRIHIITSGHVECCALHIGVRWKMNAPNSTRRRHRDHSHSGREHFFSIPSNQIGNSVAAPIVFRCQLSHIACKRCYNFHCMPHSTSRTIDSATHTHRFDYNVFFSTIHWLQWNVDGMNYTNTVALALHLAQRRPTFGCNFSQMSIMSFAMRWRFSFIWRYRIFFSSVPPLSHLIRIIWDVAHKCTQSRSLPHWEQYYSTEVNGRKQRLGKLIGTIL